MYEGFRKETFQHDYQIFYNQKLKKNFGIGINANHRASWDQTSEISIPVSYNWNISGQNHLAIGLAPSFRNYNPAEFYLDSAGNIQSPSRNYFQTHAGVTYHFKNVYAGFGVRNLHLRSWGDLEAGTWEPHLYGNFSFETPVGSRSVENHPHTLILSALYTYVNGFNRVDLNARMQFKNGLNAFIGGRVGSGFTMGTGWDFFQKLRCLYSISWQRNNLNNGNNVSHEFSVVYHVTQDD